MVVRPVEQGIAGDDLAQLLAAEHQGKQITFAAPPNEGIAAVVVLAGAASGSALLTVAK